MKHVVNPLDPVYGDILPKMYKDREVAAKTKLHPELHKMIYSNLPEPEYDAFGREVLNE